MKKLEEMSNNQLQIEMKQLQHAHIAQKDRILVEIIKMEEIEKKYARAKEIILNRLKR
jgi:hypothetical protein